MEKRFNARDYISSRDATSGASIDTLKSEKSRLYDGVYNLLGYAQAQELDPKTIAEIYKSWPEESRSSLSIMLTFIKNKNEQMYTILITEPDTHKGFIEALTTENQLIQEIETAIAQSMRSNFS